jgi:ribonuclease D
LIDTNDQLAPWLARLDAAPWLALDTEADSLHAYPEKVCLIQISLPGQDMLIDPLAGMDLNPLFAHLRPRELILHGADYDLRLLCRTYGFVPHAIFDTMLAARLIGCERFGLSDLVQRFLNLTLEKGPQKANWARRPLTPKMEAYARNDTHHLHALATILREQLEAKGRLAWAREWCGRLSAECTRPVVEDPDTVWRVKGGHRLRPRGLAVLRELWRWREAEAIAADRPPYFMLSHEKMVELSHAAEHHPPHHRRVELRITPRRQAAVLEAIEAGLALPESECPRPLRPAGRRATEAEVRRADRLRAVRDRRAAELGLDPSIIAPRYMLLALAQNREKHEPELMHWQRELLRDEPV